MLASVIIPTLNAEAELPGLIAALQSQSLQDIELIIIDSSSTDSTAHIAERAGARLIRIDRHDFNHGSTRNLAAGAANGEFLIFLTQDALPFDTYMLANLIAPLQKDSCIVMSYARQIARPYARPSEKIFRSFNYPEQEYVKKKADIPELGVKTFFCSNACAAYRRQIHQEMGGFRSDTIMNEDMEFVYRIIMQGYMACYAAEARVLHSHDYTLIQQFQRYVDIGVFFARNPELAACANNESEGQRFVFNALRLLWGQQAYKETVRLIIDCALRLIGYRLGKLHEHFPRSFMRSISMNKGFWIP